MQKLPRIQLGVLLAMASAALFLVLSLPAGPMTPGIAQADPPADQEYTGVKRCASCHFAEFMAWRQTPHARAFQLLPAQYQKDPDCLRCHTTGYGEPSGFQSAAATPDLASITCETCHGPGSEHEKIAQPFAQVKELTPEQEAAVRGSIHRMLPQNVCLDCHTTKAHLPSETPPALRKKR